MYLTSSQQYIQTTELAKRVLAWEEKIKPKLDEEVVLLVFISDKTKKNTNKA